MKILKSMKKLTNLMFTCVLCAVPIVSFGTISSDSNDENNYTYSYSKETSQVQECNSRCEKSCKGLFTKLPKISGYLQTGWNYTNNDKTSTSSFQAKRLRLLMDGRVNKNIDFRLQIEAFNGISGSKNGNGQKNLQVMDAFATWKIAPEFKIRAGQFYTPLGYENYDISPSTLETVDFSNIVYRIACRNPYEYNFVDYGRDLGIIFMGDLGNSGKGFRYFHYDLALTNGSLPCSDDKNMSKDIYISATIRPIRNFNFKATYNYGEYTSNSLSGGKGMTGKAGSKYNPMNRFVAGMWYNDPKGLDLRAEFGLISSKIENITHVDEKSAYILAAYHIGKFLPLVRWDMYKDGINKSTAAANYNRMMLGVTYQLFKNAKVQLNWGHFMYPKDVEVANGYKTSEQIQIMGLFNF